MTDEASETGLDPNSRAGSVLVAVDFTPDSESAVIWACDYAVSVKAKLLVLHVVHDPADAPGYYRTGETDLLRPMEDVASEMMGQFLEKIETSYPHLKILKEADRVLVKGIPATRILEVAESEGARLIVMGSRGRTGLPHLLLGSKAERVVQMSPIPVTIVKAHATDD